MASSSLLGNYIGGIKNFARKKSIIVHLIDLKEKKWIAYNQKFPCEKNIFEIEKLDIKNGIKFASTIYNRDDYVHVRSFQILRNFTNFVGENLNFVTFSIKDDNSFDDEEGDDVDLVPIQQRGSSEKKDSICSIF